MQELIETALLGTWSVLLEMAPYLLFGFAVAGVLSVLVSPETIERHLGGRGFGPILKATLFGIPLPLCSCGVIPVAASLRRHGATRGATTSFLLSTPQTGIDSIMVTFALLGPIFTIFRPLAALITGLGGGALVTLFDKPDQATESVPPCEEACCTNTESQSRFIRAFQYAFMVLPRDIAKPLLAGLALVGIITAVVPEDFFASAIGTGLGAMFVMMLVGLPVYVCATASVPIAVALMAKGVTPGAAFVFLMTGPATNAATLAVLWKLMGKKTTVLYLLTVMIGALGFGIALDWIFTIQGVPTEMPMGWMMPMPIKIGSAVILAGILGYGLLFKKGPGVSSSFLAEGGAPQWIINIQGMTCSQCVEQVRRALLKCSGVQTVEVLLHPGKATVQGDKVDSTHLLHAIESLGYTAKLDERSLL